MANEVHEPAVADTESKPANSNPLAFARDIAFVATVYLFFAGFWYQYYWYQALGIPLHAIDVPINQLLVFAYYTLAANAFWAVVLAVIAIIAIAVAPIARAIRTPWAVASQRAFVAAVLIAAFPLLFFWSKSATYAAINSNVEGHVGAIDRFVFRKGSDKLYSSRLLEANGSSSLALVVVAEDDANYYVLKIPPRPADESNGCSSYIPHTFLFTVRKADVLSIEAWIPGRDPGGQKYGIRDTTSPCAY